MPATRFPPPLDAARELAPRIRAAADEIEASRELPRPLFEAIADAGLEVSDINGVATYAGAIATRVTSTNEAGGASIVSPSGVARSREGDVITYYTPEDDRAVTIRVSQIVSLEVANRPAA